MSSATLCPWRVNCPRQLLLWAKGTVCLLLTGCCSFSCTSFTAHCSLTCTYQCSRLARKRMHFDGDHSQLQARERPGKQLSWRLRPLGETRCDRQLGQQFCHQARAETTAQPQKQKSLGILQATATLSPQAAGRYFLGYRPV